MRSLHVVLTAPPDGAPIASRGAWWERHQVTTRVESRPFDQAVLGGFSADRVGYAFASGYQAALRAMFPDLPEDRPASFCVTERGGGHPRAIETRLEAVTMGGPERSPQTPPQGEGAYRVTGRKRWATLGGDAGVLLVVASAGVDPQGKNRLRVVRIDGAARGVRREPMPEPPFIPEIAHDEIDLAGALVTEADLLPGDGYTRYVRPFRTVEDVYVTTAILAYLIREVRREGLPRPIAERLSGVLAALSALAGQDPSDPVTHVALAGTLELMRAPVDEMDKVWAKTESPAHARWERDRLLLTVATSAREKRRARAWERLVTGADEESTGGL